MLLPWRDVPLAVNGRELAINTSITEGEAAALAELATDGGCVEIGSAYGYSAIVMAQRARSVVAIDPHHQLDSFATMQDNLASAGVADKVRIWLANSGDALPQLPSDTYDLVFVDGDHHHSQVTFDIAHGWRAVRPGGHLAVHDYGEDTCTGVLPAVDAFRHAVQLEEMTVDTLWVAAKPLVD